MTDYTKAARPARKPKSYAISKAELLQRIERLEYARRLIDQELRELTSAYVAPRDTEEPLT